MSGTTTGTHGVVIPLRQPGSTVAGESLAWVAQTPTAHTGKLRLTRRGRFIFLGLPLLLLVAAVLLVGGFLGSSAKANVTGGAMSGNRSQQVTVLQGQTLWQIASAADASRDTRDVLHDIVELNSLKTSTVHAGQQLFVPGHA